MDELRWILLGIGILIIVGVYYYGDRDGQPKPKKKANPAPRPRDVDPDPEFEQEIDRLGAMLNGDRDEHPETEAGHPPADEPDRIITLYLRPKSDARISGPAVFDAAEKVGLEFGEMGIFHRMHEAGERRYSVFSLANMTNPGSFDKDAIGQISCQGLCLFMVLPNPLPSLDALDALLAAGQRLADLLDAELLDEAQSSLLRQYILQLREEMRAFDRENNPLI